MSAVIDVVPANMGHVCELAVNMRDADSLEVQALGYTPYDALFRSLVLSGGESWTFLVNGRVGAIGGVMNYGLLQRAGIAWVLTGKLVDKHPKAFWRASQAALAGLRTRYGFLTNVVDSRYTSSLSWLKRLGFEIHDEFYINGVPFTRIVMRSA